MAACESCGRFGELKSYDTTLYFVVLFLPVIPLGRKRILDECPSCQRHKVIALRRYQDARQKDLTEAIQAMKSAPGDPGKAAAALQAMLAYQDQANFVTLAQAAVRTFSQDADLLALVAEGQMFFNHHTEAESAWRLALQVRDSAEFRQRLAVTLIRLFRPAEAEPLLEPVLSERRRDDVGLLLFLVEGYQATADHAAALAVLDRLSAVWPELASDKELRRYRKLSEKNRGQNQAIRSPLLAAPRTRSDRPDVGGRFAKIFVPLAALAVVCGYLYWCASEGHSRPVYVVNGTDLSYTVTVNDKTVRLAPRGRTRIEQSEGDWTIQPAPDNPGLDPATVSFRTRFLLRPFMSRTLVLNPDRVAILIKESTVYSSRPGQGDMPAPSVHCGQVLYDFGHVDYAFAGFPSNITVSENSSSSIKKTRVYMEDPPRATPEVLSGIREALGAEGAIEYLARRARYEPTESLWLLGFSAFAEPKRVIDFVQPRLAQRPVLVEWHRMYQSCTERLSPAHNLAAEYRRLAGNEPGEPLFTYLLGRVTKPDSEAGKLFAESERGAKPIGYGYHALAYGRLCRGEFAEAANLATRALAARPDAVQFHATWALASECAGRFGQLVAKAREERRKDPADAGALVREYVFLVALKKEAEAESALTRYEEQNAKQLQPESRKMLRAICRSSAAYSGGRTNDYLRLCEEIGGPAATFAAAVTRRDAVRASEILTTMGKPEFADHLLVYTIACLAGNEPLARRHWTQALDLMSNDVEIDHDLLQAVRADRLDNPAVLTDAHILPRGKSILLMAYGLARPEHRSLLHAKAAQLNA
jgi:tetratricopeptide (TPR) repeat protein